MTKLAKKIFLNKFNLRKKLFILNITFFLSLALLVYFGLYLPAVKNLESNISNVIKSSAVKKAEQVNKYFSQMIVVSDIIQQNKNYKELLNNNGENDYLLQIKNYWRISEELLNLKLYFSDIDIKIFVSKESLASNETVIFFDNSTILNDSKYENVKNSYGNICWVNNINSIRIMRIFEKSYNDEQKNIFSCVEVNSSKINNLLKDTYNDLSIEVYLSDENNIIAANSVDQTYNGINFSDRITSLKKNNINHQIITQPVGIGNWTIHTVRPKNYNNAELNRLQGIFWTCMIIIFILFSLLSNYIIFNIKKLERKKRDMEMFALQSQIKPHFIYNTLDSINWALIKAKQYDISNVIVNLAMFIRKSLSDEGEIVTINDELEHIKMYIEIMKSKVDFNINLIIDAEEDLKNKTAVKFTFQPIVENCIIHGFEDFTGDDACIIVTIKLEKNKIITVIKDNGKGFDINAVSITNKKSYGIANVKKRLQLLFEDNSVFEIKSEPGKGTEVKLGWVLKQ